MFSKKISVGLILFSLTSCLPHSNVSIKYTESTPAGLPIKKVLSIYSKDFTTCQYPPQAKIFHFPMYHTPPEGYLGAEVFDQVTRSQFQLLHTIISNYGNIVIFEEGAHSDLYNKENLLNPGSASFTRLDQKIFFWSERKHLAQSIFKSVPLYYEHLTQPQKQYLYDTGGSLTLFFMGYVDQIYKVISRENFSIAINNLNRLSSSYRGGFKELVGLPRGANPQRDHWLFNYRENELKKEVLNFYQKKPNYQGVVLIAYGANHDFSDDFAGFPFSRGINCTNWLQTQ